MKKKFLNKPILVTGLPRSGTSMITGMLGECGAWTGSTVAASKENIKGFYEHTSLRELVNKRILSQLGCDPLGIRKLPDDDLPSIDKLKATVLQLIKQDGYQGLTPWMFKEPKLLLLWSAYKESFPDATWIIVRRDKEEVVDSCLRTSFMKQHSTERAFWEELMTEYERRMELLKQSGVKYQEIWAKDIVKPESRDVLKKLVKNLKLQWNERAVNDFYEPTVWHGKK